MVLNGLEWVGIDWEWLGGLKLGCDGLEMV